MAHKSTRVTSRPPSRAQMAKEERHYRAESMVREALMNTAAAKQQIKAAEKMMAQAEKQVQAAIKMSPKPSKGK